MQNNNELTQQNGMKFLVFGAGAIGTYIGGSLALQGNLVVFLEQPEAVNQLANKGLRLRLRGQDYQISAPVVVGEMAAAIAYGPFDAAIFALKSFDTLSAIQHIEAYKNDLPPFLCLQNGVENEIILADFLGNERVIAGTVTSSIGRNGVGDVVLERLRGMGLASTHPRSISIHQELNKAGLNGRLYPHALEMKWSKLLTNLLANASSAILNMTPAQIFAHPGLYRLEVEQLREALRVMQKLGYQVVDLPATPVRALAFAVNNLPVNISRPILGKALGGGRGNKMPSFHIDLHSGRGKSEVSFINGAVVRFGQKTGVPTPVNQGLNDTLASILEGRYPIEFFAHQPDKLIRLITR